MENKNFKIEKNAAKKFGNSENNFKKKLQKFGKYFFVKFNFKIIFLKIKNRKNCGAVRKNLNKNFVQKIVKIILKNFFAF